MRMCMGTLVSEIDFYCLRVQRESIRETRNVKAGVNHVLSPFYEYMIEEESDF